MNGTVSDEDKLKLLDEQLAGAPFTTLKMGLSTTNIVPTHATVLADLTPGELAVAGYARQDVTNWTAAALTADFHALSSADPVTFLNGSGGATANIYTWFLVDTVANKLVMAGAFDLPFILPATVGSYTTTPFWRLTGE